MYLCVWSEEKGVSVSITGDRKKSRKKTRFVKHK